MTNYFLLQIDIFLIYFLQNLELYFFGIPEFFETFKDFTLTLSSSKFSDFKQS